MKKRAVDVLIVGQGLAGSIVTQYCWQRNLSVLAIDEDRERTSSQVAAGLVNPITGRRFVKTWMFDELDRAARLFYNQLESTYGTQLLHRMPIVRSVEDRRFLDDIEAKTADPHYEKFIERCHVENHSYFIPSSILYQINGGYRVDLKQIIQLTRTRLENENRFERQSFDYNKLVLGELDVQYGEISAKRIIFCEGAAGRFNPWFRHLTLQPTKGEVFELVQANTDERAYKRDLILLPFASDKLWCGALNFWEFDDDQPSDEGELILLQKLRKVYQHPPHIHRHLAAIRPTVKDRRPLLGTHADCELLHIFNGLGTKGTLLGPYFANQLLASIFDGKELMREVDIARCV